MNNEFPEQSQLGSSRNEAEMLSLVVYRALTGVLQGQRQNTVQN